MADFSILDSQTGFYGKKLTTNRGFIINQPKEDGFYGGVEPVIVETAVNEKPEEYWKEVRHESISADQQGIYDMVDSLKTVPMFMTYVDVVNFLFQGYKVQGPIEIGPVFTFLSYNFVEGVRPKFSIGAFAVEFIVGGIPLQAPIKTPMNSTAKQADSWETSDVLVGI